MEELDIQEVLYKLKKYIGIIIIVTLIGTILGIVYSFFLIKPMYKASTTLILTKSSESNGVSDGGITQSDITLNQKLVADYMEIIKSREVARNAIYDGRFDINSEELQSSISVSSKQGTDILELTVKNSEPDMAANLANALAVSAAAKVKEIYKIDNLSVIDKAEVPVKPYNKNNIKIIAITTFGSFILVCGVIFVITYFSNTIRNDDELERILNLIVLAVIPKVGE